MVVEFYWLLIQFLNQHAAQLTAQHCNSGINKNVACMMIDDLTPAAGSA